MQGFIKKHFLILMFLSLGTLTGTGFYIFSSKTTIYQIIYEYPSVYEEEIPLIFKSDTLVEIRDGLLYRNAKTSYADTLQDKNIIRGEVKLYVSEDFNKDSINSFFKSLDDSQRNKLISARFVERSKSVMIIFKFALIGLFLGTLIQFLRNLLSKSPEK